MSKPYQQQLVELARLIHPYTVNEGVNSTELPSLSLIRESDITEPIFRLNEASFCIVVQGQKEMLLGQERFQYGSGSYIVATMDLPVSGQVIEASPATPYLALKLEFTCSEILEIVQHTRLSPMSNDATRRAMYVSKTSPELLNAVIRLAQLLEGDAEDIFMLFPLFKKEILYRILKGPQGSALKQMAQEGSHTYRIRNVIEHMVTHISQPVRIEELAELANMSQASFHRHFKAVTAMSPLQFIKQLRLQEARRLLMSQAVDASEAAYQVGYESPSQFSREYSRLFGCPPMEDIKRLRGSMY
ncbi:AraC-like DNA-binding protein [Paenibacillus sp. 4624]|uniref:AraC family transcriptional regulator n=1 Tax=Paenibacillus amylolyticus TaxID=1451 RepID=A0A5M9WPW0_PAEAM|nr:AraC family transcriptional regulator [Paenibacillus amylolyticus]KAA8783650.1 AraC family transcriptional regulator [Paenibacillus amylolyticus]